MGGQPIGGDSIFYIRSLSCRPADMFAHSTYYAAFSACGKGGEWQHALAGPRSEDGESAVYRGDVADGECPSVRGQLAGYSQQLQGTFPAFAAIKADGSVVTWGGGRRNPVRFTRPVSQMMTTHLCESNRPNKSKGHTRLLQLSRGMGLW